MKRIHLKIPGVFIWIFKVFVLQIITQVLRCSCYDKHSEDVGTLEFDDINLNYNPLENSETFEMPVKINDQYNDMDYFMGYDVQEPQRFYESKDTQLSKRSAKGDRIRAKLRRMVKRTRLINKGSAWNKNGSNVELSNNSVKQPKQHNREYSYIGSKNVFGKDIRNNKYVKSSLVGNDITKNDDNETKVDIDSSVPNTSNVKITKLIKLGHPILTEDEIWSQNINLEKQNKDVPENSTYRERKKDENIKKNKKRLFLKNKVNRGKNKELRLKNGIISPINNIIRRKLKNKIRKSSENSKQKNLKERKGKEHVGDDEKICLNKQVKSKINPGEVLSYGLEGNFKNLSIINHGFLKAFEKKYYDNNLDEPTSKHILKEKLIGFSDTGHENTTEFDYTSMKIKSKDLKERNGLNVEDYYEPLTPFNNKEHFISKSQTNKNNHLPKKGVHDFRKEMSIKKTWNKNVDSQNSIPHEKFDNYKLNTIHGINEHDNKKHNTFSGKVKHKIYTNAADSGKKRGARDINGGNHKDSIYNDRMLHRDNESFDYDDIKKIDDDIDNRYHDIETPKLILEAPEPSNNYQQTFHRLKKDYSHLKKLATNKSKYKDENINLPNDNKLRKTNSLKGQVSGYNGEEHEPSDICVGYKCDYILNTTDPSTTIDVTTSVTTKRNNNGKSKSLTKSRKIKLETKNSTNHTNEIDEHSLFLCGQLADDFVKSVFTKIKRSKKILKELGFGNETEQSCNRCIETKENKLPDLEVVKGTLGKCSSKGDVKHTNSKCYPLPDPMESFIHLLLSLRNEEEDSGHNRIRDDSTFIFNGDDFESFTKNENGAAMKDKSLEGRESGNTALFEKQHLREEGGDEKIEDGGPKSRKHGIEENDKDKLSKDDQGEVYQSIDEELESETKSPKNLKTNRLQQESGEQQAFQSEENLKGNDVIDVFDGQDSLNSDGHKYQTFKDLKHGDTNINQNQKAIKNNIIPFVSSNDYRNEEYINDVPISQMYGRKNIDYFNNKPNTALFGRERQNMPQFNALGNTRKHTYQRDDSQGTAVDFEPQKPNINPVEARVGFPGTLDDRYGNSKNYLSNNQIGFIKNDIMSQNPNKYVSDPLSEVAVDKSIEYQLFPGHDRSYNAMPFLIDNQRMGKRETPSDTNEEEVIFFELPNIEYDLY